MALENIRIIVNLILFAVLNTTTVVCASSLLVVLTAVPGVGTLMWLIMNMGVS